MVASYIAKRAGSYDLARFRFAEGMLPWIAVAGATGYRVYGNHSGTAHLVADVGLTTSCVGTGLTNNGKHLPKS